MRLALPTPHLSEDRRRRAPPPVDDDIVVDLLLASARVTPFGTLQPAGLIDVDAAPNGPICAWLRRPASRSVGGLVGGTVCCPRGGYGAASRRQVHLMEVM